MPQSFTVNPLYEDDVFYVLSIVGRRRNSGAGNLRGFLFVALLVVFFWCGSGTNKS